MGELRQSHDGHPAVSIERGGRKHSGLRYDDYKELIENTCRSWNRGVEWLRDKFGDNYKGHMGLLGTALVACYAMSRCHDVVIEPKIRRKDITLDLSVINPDIAIVQSEGLLIIEVKVHRKEPIALTSQLDDFILKYGRQLKKWGIYLAVIHFWMGGRTPAIKLPPWAVELSLSPGRKLDELYGELDRLLQAVVGRNP